MQQVKIFSVLESDVDRLELHINTWIASTPGIRIQQISGNFAPQTETGRGAGLTGGGGNSSDLFLVILYETDAPKAG